MKRKQKKKEERAIEAIIAGCLRGWGTKEWHEVFRRMDEIQKRQETERRRRDAQPGHWEEPRYGSP